MELLSLKVGYFLLCIYSESIPIKGCKCNGKTIKRNEDLMDGECNSFRASMGKTGEKLKPFCYVNPDEECGDTVDGWSFNACNTGSWTTQKNLPG